ncbi:MAG: NADH-quinone oxidoreductase subunit NuoK [Stackebrandtia sp.]
MHPVIPYVLAALLFGVGVYGVLTRRNAVLMLAAVELMLGAVNLVLVTADVAPLTGESDGHTGQSFALFIIVIAAAEIGVGLALVLHLFRLRGSIDTEHIDTDDREAAV